MHSNNLLSLQLNERELNSKGRYEEITRVEQNFDEYINNLPLNNATEDNIKKIQLNEDKIKNVIDSLQANFPIKSQQKQFELYPFSNEDGYWKAINSLKKIKIDTDQAGVTLLVGESNFISLLPYLPNKKLVILLDIEPLLHKQTKHMLTCLFESETPEEYKKKFNENHFDYLSVNNAQFYALIRNGEPIYHFLHNRKNFDRCKEAARKLSFVHIELNLMDSSSCEKFANILNENNALLTLCNFTNIHHYDERHESLSISLPTLLKNSPHCVIMYSPNPFTSSLRTTVSIGLEDYFLNPFAGNYNKVVICDDTRCFDQDHRQKDDDRTLYLLKAKQNIINAVVLPAGSNEKWISYMGERKRLASEQVKKLFDLENLVPYLNYESHKDLVISRYDGNQDLIDRITSICDVYKKVTLPSTHNQIGFFAIKNNIGTKIEKNEKCYVGLVINTRIWGDAAEETIIDHIMKGILNINYSGYYLHAHDSYPEAEEFMRKVTKGEKPFWIFTMRGNKDKINLLLNYEEIYYLQKAPYLSKIRSFDFVDNGMKLSTHFISVHKGELNAGYPLPVTEEQSSQNGSCNFHCNPPKLA